MKDNILTPPSRHGRHRIFTPLTKLLLFGLLALGLSQCRSVDSSDTRTEVHIRLPEDPDMLHPLLSKSILATEVESYIFAPMTAVDPVTLGLKPFLIESIPELQSIDTGVYAGMSQLSLTLRPEARWDNGTPVTAHDVLFTLKTVFLPGVAASSWRSTLNIIHDLEIDPDDPRRFRIIIKENYFRAIMIATNYEVYPEYHYDPGGSLRAIPLRELTAEGEELARRIEGDSAIRAFRESFQSARFTRHEIEGAGPYELVFWQDKLQIRLEKKADWWAADLAAEDSIFTARPDAIVFKIIPDEQTALAALRSGEIDVMEGVPAAVFHEIKKDSAQREKFHFFTPSFNRYYFLALNTKDPVLRDPQVRRALAHMVEVDRFIEVLLEGMAIRTIGHIHPSLPYYRDDLPPIPYDLDKARELLSASGWADSDGDGILDKVVDGRKRKFSVKYLATRRAIGQQMALSFQENARKLGIEVEVVQNDFREHLKAIRKRDFHIVAAAKTLPDGVVDPFQTWHTSNDTPEGDNWSGFGDAHSDSLIQVIRTASSEADRLSAYSEFQEIIYREQPFIFLLCPTEGILVSKRFETFASDLKPGYHVNYFRQVQ